MIKCSIINQTWQNISLNHVLYSYSLQFIMSPGTERCYTKFHTQQSRRNQLFAIFPYDLPQLNADPLSAFCPRTDLVSCKNISKHMVKLSWNNRNFWQMFFLVLENEDHSHMLSLLVCPINESCNDLNPVSRHAKILDLPLVH